MTSQHLNFDQLSDLFDNEVTDSERMQYNAHLKDCAACRKEYESLCMCLSMVRTSTSNCGCMTEICHKTIALYKARIRRRQYFKSMPAIAASVLIVTGIGFMRTADFTMEKSYFTAQVSTENDLQRIIDTVRDSRGKILNITGEYIDGEIPRADLARLARVLHYFRIRHTVISEQPSERIVTRPGIYGVEDVSFNTSSIAGSSMFGRGIDFAGRTDGSDRIRVRIFK